MTKNRSHFCGPKRESKEVGLVPVEGYWRGREEEGVVYVERLEEEEMGLGEDRG